MEVALGILGSFVPLLILGAIIFGVARLMAKREKAAHESVGVAIRRFFQYTLMLATLVLASFGVAGLIDTAVSAGDRITVDAAGTALAIAFTVVGLPVFVGLAAYTSHKLRTDPFERHSVGWAAYLTIALIGSLVTVMSLVGVLLADLLDSGGIDTTIGIYAVVWAIVWVSHWWASQAKGDPHRLQVHILLGSAAGLIATFAGTMTGTTAVFHQIYGRLFQASILDTGIEPLAGPLIILVVGVPVWWWYWVRHGRRLGHNSLWLGYVLLLGVLGGAIAAIVGAGTLVFGVLQWLLGDPSAASAATHFAFIPGSVGAILAGGASWLYHGTLVGDRGDRDRVEVDRVYDYLLSGAGLVVAASGLATLLTTSSKALAGRGLTSFQSGDAVAAALTLLLVGVPLWWRYWSTIQRYRRADPDDELRSITRRIYIFLLFGVAGIVAVVNLIIMVFMVFNDILEGNFGSATLDDASVPIALLLTAGAVAGYHFTVFREDRAAVVDVAEPMLARAIVIGSAVDPIVDAIRSDIGASVSIIEAASDTVTAAGLEEAIDVLRGTHRPSAVVITRQDGTYEVIPTNR